MTSGNDRTSRTGQENCFQNNRWHNYHLGNRTYLLYFYGDFINGDDFRVIDFIGILYGLLLPVLWYGYTLGRRVTGNRIARIEGRKVGVGTMLLRELVAGIFYALTFGIGLIVSVLMVGIREDHRAIHDFIAGTYVTRCPPEKNENAHHI